MPRITFEADFDEKHVKFEDGKQALIWDHRGYEIVGDVSEESDEGGTTVKFWSWDETREHKSIKRFIGKRVRITVEVASILDQIVEAVDDDSGHGLGFEIGEKVRFVSKVKGSIAEMRNSRATHIQVVGLDVTERRSIKINWHAGDGECYEWFDPRDIEKLGVLDKLAEIK